MLSTEKYQPLLGKAIDHFWRTRNLQLSVGKKSNQGNRSAVTGGKQLDGFLELFAEISKDMGVPKEHIFTKGNFLPGYFRPTKDWDFLIISPKKQLLVVLEFKSQVGSFGNNFNNRTEEALGSAVDLWTAFKENGFPQNQPPWLGYLILVEKNEKSSNPVRLQEPHYAVRKEFLETGYLNRYALFCQKLMQERHYSSTCLLWTDSSKQFGSVKSDISFESFLLSFMGFIQSKLNQFEV